MIQVFVNDATTIDFSYLHPERGLLGETLIVDLKVQGSADPEGMVLDFATIKRTLKLQIDAIVDHKLLIPLRSRCLDIHSQTRENIELSWDQHIVQKSPIEAVCLLPCERITPENIAQFLVSQLKPQLPENVHDLMIHLRPEAIDGPYYHYSHGLKAHEGNCQRIAHGHRSKIAIFQNDDYQAALSDQWANRFRDIYIGHSEDLVVEESNKHHVQFRYQAQQGLFELKLPRQRVYMMDQTTTVEHICLHIFRDLCNRWPNQSFRVDAYEGYQKGAICDSNLCQGNFVRATLSEQRQVRHRD